MMSVALRILHLEDDPADADLVAATLAADGLVCDVRCVASRAQFIASLDSPFDLILSDYQLPGFDGVRAQMIAHERRPDLPFVFVSGTMGEEVATERLKAGATDYVLKQRLARLPAAVRRALEESRERRERRQAEAELGRLHAELERRVEARTAELAEVNAALARREGELAEAKAFLEHLVAASPSMIFRFEPATLQVTYVSPNIGWLLGYAPAEAIGVPGLWSDIIHPDDRPSVVARLRDAMDSTVVQIEQEYRCRTKDGRYRWFFNLLRIEYDDCSQPTSVLGYALDITDRKAAEEDLRQTNIFLDSILENLPDVIFVKEAVSLEYVRLNRAAEQLLGMRRGELIGRATTEVLPAPVADEFMAQDREVVETRASIDIPEQILPLRDGRARVMHTKKIPILDSTGAAQYILGISQDITERRLAEEQARLARMEADRANRAKSEFLSRMSHDLRTPLNAILGFAQVLEFDVKTQEEADSVRQILNGGTHLLELINEVLDIASIEAGRLALSPESVPVGEAVTQVIDLLRPLADIRKIALIADPSVWAGLHVRGDRQRIKQIVVNLIGNAIKYNRDGGSVTVRCEARDDVVETHISDTGPGIAPERMALLFQPFERLGAEAGSIEGTGLGLAVSKGLAEAMNGRMTVASTVGVGTTFSFGLPRTAAPADDHQTEAAGTDRTGEIGESTGTILYIEDNQSNVRLIARLLKRRPGVSLLSATTGEEGIAMAQRIRPRLILLDLHLPDMTGEDVLGRLKAAPASAMLPVAVLTADAVPDQDRRLRDAGAVAYLTKPLELTALLRLIDRWLGAPAGRPE